MRIDAERQRLRAKLDLQEDAIRRYYIRGGPKADDAQAWLSAEYKKLGITEEDRNNYDLAQEGGR
jgi:hypothetical protein